MDKDMTYAPNQRYINIVKEIVQPRFEAKLIDWATRLTDQHKKGLHVIKFIIDMKGMKRFKKNGAEIALSSDCDVRNLPNAKEVFRRMTNTTRYAE